jgi:hypothetical protein
MGKICAKICWKPGIDNDCTNNMTIYYLMSHVWSWVAEDVRG